MLGDSIAAPFLVHVVMALAIAGVFVTLLFLGLLALAEWGDAQKAREHEDRTKRAAGELIDHGDSQK